MLIRSYLAIHSPQEWQLPGHMHTAHSQSNGSSFLTVMPGTAFPAGLTAPIQCTCTQHSTSPMQWLTVMGKPLLGVLGAEPCSSRYRSRQA